MADFYSNTSVVYRLHLGIWVDSQSIENNTTKLGYFLDFENGGSSVYAAKNLDGENFKVTIGGKTVFNKSVGWSLSGGQKKRICSGSTTVTHRDDGTMSVNCSFSRTAGLSANYYPGNLSGSGAYTLPAIMRASDVSLDNRTLTTFGRSLDIIITPASPSFTHTLRYSYYDATGTISTNAGDSTTWSPPESLALRIPHVESTTLTIYCDTYSGSTKIGTKSASCELRCPSTWVPAIDNVYIEDGMENKPSSMSSLWIQGKSKPKVTGATGEGSHGSTLATWYHEMESTTYTGYPTQLNSIKGSGNITITTTVSDSRGRRSDAKTTILDVVPYASPTISSFMAVRSTDGEPANDGTQITFTYGWVTSSVNSKNVITAKVQHKTASGGWEDVATISSPAYEDSGTVTSPSSKAYSADVEHVFRLLVTDSFTSAQATATVSASGTLINYAASGKGLGLGVVSSNNGSLQLGIPIEAPHVTSASRSGGFLKILTLKLADRTYNYAGMEFKYHCGAMPMVFANGKIVINSSTSTDPTPALVTSTCPDNPIFIHKSATRTWDVYVPKQGTEQAAVFDIFQYRMPDIEVSFANEQVASLPSGYIRAKWEYLDALYPVGSIIQSNSSTNPGTRLGGTWEQYAQGRTLIGAGSGNDGTTSKSFSVNSTGGKYKSDQLNLSASNYGCTLSQPGYGGRTVLAPGSMANSGSSEKTAGIDIVQPYIVVYMWRRTA